MNPKKRWYVFIDLFVVDSNLVAMGPFISCEHHKHIQSFMLVVDKRGLAVVEKTWRCPHLNEQRTAWVMDTEVV